MQSECTRLLAAIESYLHASVKSIRIPRPRLEFCHDPLIRQGHVRQQFPDHWRQEVQGGYPGMNGCGKAIESPTGVKYNLSHPIDLQYIFQNIYLPTGAFAAIAQSGCCCHMDYSGTMMYPHIFRRPRAFAPDSKPLSIVIGYTTRYEVLTGVLYDVYYNDDKVYLKRRQLS